MNEKQSDNESALRDARKNLPFPKLLERVATEKAVGMDECLFCRQAKTSGLLKRPIVTKKIEKSCIAQIEAVDIVKVVGDNLALKRQGANWVACCPFHNEKHPSFNVQPAKNRYICFGCKKSGGPIQFIRDIAGMEFIPAVEKLATDHGITLRYETHGEKTVWRCSNRDCPSKTSVEGAELDEVGFVGRIMPDAAGKELSRKDAFKAYLKMANVAKAPRQEPKPVEAPASRFKPKPVVEKPVEKLPNPVLPETVTPAPSPKPPSDEEREDLLWKCIEVIRKDAKASVAHLHRRLKMGPEEALRILNELEKRGFLGPARGAKPRAILKLPKPRPNIIKIKIGDEVTEVDANLPTDGKAATVEADEFAPGAEFAGEETPEGILLGRAALEFFYSKQTLLKEDDDALWLKRGLTTSTNIAMGNVSTVDSNYDLLYKMQDLFSMDELLASGLWLPEDRQKKKPRRPNSQFCGFGQLGKKPKAQRKNKDDKIIWGKSYPILIPTFDEDGKILKLRPHKGGAPGSTLCGANRIYIPRDYRKIVDRGESFYRVVICEAEFKAQACWQTFGAGRQDGVQPLGVCGLPGIYFGKNYDIREELETWLRDVGCKVFDVAFDDEDKSDKQLREERHEAIIWAKYLAASLSKKLEIAGRVLVLPKTWRMKKNDAGREVPDPKGKADWDSRLAHVVHHG